MRVLQIVGGMDIGGTETMLMNLYRKLYKEVQFDFISYYSYEGYYEKEIKDLGGRIITLDSPNKVGKFKAIKQLANIIKQNDYEIVHAHTLFNCGVAMIAAKLGGAKIRVSHAHTNLENNQNLIRRIYQNCMRALIRFTSTDLLSCSNSAGEYLFGKKVRKNKAYKVIPNYIEYEKILNFKGSSLKDELGIEKEGILLGNVGRFVESKNQIFLIDVAEDLIKKNNKIHLVLVGYGDLEERIRNEIKNRNLEKNIHILGVSKEMDKIMNAIDIFLMPSKYEGLGLVLLEAQAASCKCIVSNAIQEEAILDLNLVEKRELDKQEWEKEIFKILKHKTFIQKEKIEKAFEKKGYSINFIREKLLKIYEGNQE